jgi:peroxiredoxin
MPDPGLTMLRPGDRAPDFELPAGDREGTVALADHRRRGPVVLAMLRGIYCPFCRWAISQLGPTAEALDGAGIALLGLVVASPERSRLYFSHRPTRFPIAAAPDRATHRAYGIPERLRTPESLETSERLAAGIIRDLGGQAAPGKALEAFSRYDGFEPAAEDQVEGARPVQATGYFLIDRDGLIRWARVESQISALPKPEELIPLV